MVIAANDPLSSGPYTGNGATTSFDYEFVIFAATELQVVKQTISTGAEETLVLTTDYTVSPSGGSYPAEGTITMVVAPTADEKIVILPKITRSQDRPYSSQGSVSLVELERAYDKLTMLVRELFEASSRAVTISAFSDVADLNQLRADIELVANLLESDNLALLDVANVYTGRQKFTSGFEVYDDADDVSFGARFTIDASDNLILTRRRFDDGAGGSWAQIDVPGSTAAADASTLMRRDQGDARYLQLAGGNMTGTTVMVAGSLLTMLQIRARASDSIHDISIRDSAGNTAYAWDIRAQPTVTGAFQLRHNNVALYSQGANGALTLGGTSGALISGVGGVVSNGEIQTRTDSNNSIGFRKAAGAINALIYFNRAGGIADSPGRLTVNYYDEDGTDARVAAVIENPISKGGTLSAANSVVTRELGDVRYLQSTQAVHLPQPTTLFTGDVNDILDTTMYVVDTGTATNVPLASGYAALETLRSVNTNAATQRLTYFAGGAIYVRARAASTWGSWSLVDTSAALSGLLTEQATTSGIVFDFTGIPAGVRVVEVMLEACSLSGTDNFLIQLGDAGGVETTGYAARGGSASSTAGFVVQSAGAAFEASGTLRLSRMGGNRWLGEGVFFRGVGTTTTEVTGRKELSAELDRVRITRTGTNTFDAGAVNVRWLA